MNIRDIILPREKTKNLRWFDVVIITLILFGKFIVISTQMYLDTLKPAVEAAATAVTGGNNRGIFGRRCLFEQPELSGEDACHCLHLSLYSQL